MQYAFLNTFLKSNTFKIQFIEEKKNLCYINEAAGMMWPNVILNKSLQVERFILKALFNNVSTLKKSELHGHQCLW